jgi:putative nucleotidyltransferase with HDIG domain
VAGKTREDAWELLTEFTKNPNLIKHGLAVEAAMRAYARKFGEDEEKWAAVGLVHDFDYERYPTAEDHPFRGMEIMRERGWPEEMIEAVGSHATYADIPWDTPLKQALFASDELTGLIIAVSLVRPSKDIRDVKVKSVKKKWKDRAFAAGVNREDVEQGAELLGIELWEHVGTVLDALKGIAAELELDGRLAKG